MTNNDNRSVEAMAQSMVDDSAHYVNLVSAMAENHELNATADIVSSSGIKLVARGTRIDEHLREKLGGHHLSGTTLEKSLSIADGVTPESLSRDVAKIIDQDGWLTLLETKSGDSGAMHHGVSRLQLPPALCFRLTVARDQRPSLYRHLLTVTIISHYLALRLPLNQAGINNLLIAALCHDLGELYTSPAILEPDHQVSDEERRFIYVHPITGWLIVHELPGLDPAVARTIIQHQERLDGSGYPKGIAGDEIGLPGRILAIADVSATIMARFSDHSRLSTLLRLNKKKYDRKVVGLLHDAIVPAVSVAGRLERITLTKRLAGFATLLDGWSQLRAESGTSQAASVAFLSERMYNLRTLVLEFGFDPDSLELTIDLAEEDASIAAELTTVVDELQFQLAELSREFERRTPDWQDTLNPFVAVLLDDWLQQLHGCIEN